MHQEDQLSEFTDRERQVFRYTLCLNVDRLLASKQVHSSGLHDESG